MSEVPDPVEMRGDPSDSELGSIPAHVGDSISIEEFHRKMAVELFNAVFGLLENENRNCAETDRMIHAAHASRFHWEIAGQPVNWAIGEWQVSRVHAVVRQPDSALYHARRYLELAEDYNLGAFHVAYAHEAIARAFSINDPVKMAVHLAKAQQYGEQIPDEDERALLSKDLATITAG